MLKLMGQQTEREALEHKARCLATECRELSEHLDAIRSTRLFRLVGGRLRKLEGTEEKKKR